MKMTGLTSSCLGSAAAGAAAGASSSSCSSPVELPGSSSAMFTSIGWKFPSLVWYTNAVQHSFDFYLSNKSLPSLDMALGWGQTKELPVITLAGLTIVADFIAYFCHHFWEFINTIQSSRTCQWCSKSEEVTPCGGSIREGALMPAAVTNERMGIITG